MIKIQAAIRLHAAKDKSEFEKRYKQVTVDLKNAKLAIDQRLKKIDVFLETLKDPPAERDNHRLELYEKHAESILKLLMDNPR